MSILGLVSWEKIASRYHRPVYRDIVGCSQAGDGPPRGETRRRGYWRWWVMTAAVSVSRFQPETQVGRRSEEGLIEHTQHSPLSRQVISQPGHGPVAWAQWAVVCRATRQPIRVSFWCRSLIQITARRARTVGCQSKSQGTRYRLGLIVYDIVAVKIFDRYRNIALSIRALVILCIFMPLPPLGGAGGVTCSCRVLVCVCVCASAWRCFHSV